MAGAKYHVVILVADGALSNALVKKFEAPCQPCHATFTFKPPVSVSEVSVYSISISILSSIWNLVFGRKC